jgi:DNA-directed RNA polymerase subunit RPC12/RpoP
MEALDGNAIAGLLQEVFGTEMTTATGVCSYCGSAIMLAELVVYLQAPGTVVRCRACGNILMVFVRHRTCTCVDLGGLADLAA